MESCTFKDGAIKIDMTVTFSRAHLDIMTKNGLQKKWLRRPHCDLGGLELVETRDTGVFYLMVTICAEDYREGSANVSLKNPWILPVRFVYKSPGRLHLLCPIPSNWHLLGRVQRGRRVTNEEAQLYAAQIVCAVESLHEMGIVGLLSSENVLLDVFGNIRVITPRLFTHDQSYCVGQLAYTAPEVLSGDIPSQSADWWILGGFIYEILTGLPPFYHQDRAERDRKILMEELNMPTYLQGATADILLCLLNKNPTQRLGGAHGVSEIKKHDFFLGIDWQHPNGGCSKICPFQPHDTRNIFSNSPSRTPNGSNTGPSRTSLPRKIRESKGYLLEEYDFGPWVNGPNPERIIGRPRRSSDIFNPVLSEAMQQVPLSPDQAAAKALQADSEREGCDTEAVMARLKAALQTKQSSEKVADILDSCVSGVLETVLKSPILLVNNTPIGAIAPEILTCDVPITALEWMVELGRADLVLLLLDRGADPNCTFDETYGPALTRAARERRTQLVNILAPKTSRILALRTLCLAVEQRDIPTITSLLSGGVPCNFDAADHLLPPPLTSRYDWYHGEDFQRAPEPTFNLSPIARATRHGDVAMVRLLLSHGADPNTAYHSMLSLKPDWHATWQEATERNDSWNRGFSCGWVVQLAMQLGYRDVVDALLEGGAKIGLLNPEWPVPNHCCPMVPRSIYLHVMAGLEGSCQRRSLIREGC
jgi:serum/glucocorticoid-regulated kinase 2